MGTPVLASKFSGAQKVRPGSVHLSTYFSDTALVSPKFDSVVVESNVA